MSGDASEVRGMGCKRLSTLGDGACRMHTSGTGGRARIFYCCCVLWPLYFSICISPGLCGGQGASASLLSAAALVACIQAKGGHAGICFVCFRSCIFPFTLLPVRGGSRGCKRLSTFGGGACGMHTSGTRGWARGIFVCFGPGIFPLTFLPVCVGGRGCKHLSTLVGGACGTHISGTGGRARVIFVCVFALVFFHLHTSRSVCRAGGTSASLLSAAALVVCIHKRGGKAGAWYFLFVLPPLYLSIYISPGVCDG